MTKLAEIAFDQLQTLSEEQQDVLSRLLLEMIEANYDEDEDADPVLYEFTGEDGSIDFDKLHSMSVSVSLHDLFPEQE